MSHRPVNVVAVIAEAAKDGTFFLGEDLLTYMLLAFGGAMLVGNLGAIIRPPRAEDGPAKAPLGRSLIMAGFGACAFLWALASLVA